MEYSNVKNQDINDAQQQQLANLPSACQHHLMVPIIEGDASAPSTSSTSCASACVRNVCVRVPRPTNAFMIYANENRKCLAKQFPLDSNKEISKRLGHCWKDLEPERKAVYYTLAKQVDADHKKKYPNYVYNPKEARIRKALRDATREKMLGVGAGLAPSTAQQRPPPGGTAQRRLAQPWMLPDQDDQIMMSPGEPGGPGGGALRAGMASPMCGTGFPVMSMAPMGSYTTPMHHPHAAYINNPLAQLQQQTDLWNPYHHKSQTTKSPQDAAYLMSSHHHHHMSMSSSSSSSSSSLPYTSHVVTPTLHPAPMSFSAADSSQQHDNKRGDDDGDDDNDDDDDNRSLLSDNTLLSNNAPADHQHHHQQHMMMCGTITAKMEQPEMTAAAATADGDDDEQQQQQVEGVLLGGGGATGEVGATIRHGKIEMVEFEGESATDLIKMGFPQQQLPQQQQEKIVLQNPFDIGPPLASNNNMGVFHGHQQQQQQQQHRKKSILLAAGGGGAAGDTTAALTYRMGEVEVRKQFIIKYAENYNYDHMELMLLQQQQHQQQQQHLSKVAHHGRPVSYHYVTLPAIGCPGDVLNLPITGQSGPHNVGLPKEMYLVNGGGGGGAAGQVTQVNQALNLTTDLK